jgi:hypothetical protein
MAVKMSLGYVLSLSMAENVYMGGAMVTDPYALPLEFRYTEPVRATKLQRVLYGDVLEKYIQCDVIAGNLVSRLEQKPDILIVADANLLPVLDAARYKVVLLSASRGAPLKEYGALHDISDMEFYLQLTESGGPTRVRMATAGDATRKSETARVLSECGRTMDIFEPLNRVETAVKMLWDEVPETPSA